MASESTPRSQNASAVDLGPYEEAAARIRALNERLIESAKAAGLGTLEAYEKALRSFLDLEEKVAGATRLEWVSTLAQTHAAVVRDLAAAYTKAARDLFG
jgi:methionine synthase II (cobalamin-independent)